MVKADTSRRESSITRAGNRRTHAVAGAGIGRALAIARRAGRTISVARGGAGTAFAVARGCFGTRGAFAALGLHLVAALAFAVWLVAFRAALFLCLDRQRGGGQECEGEELFHGVVGVQNHWPPPVPPARASTQ